MSAALRRGTLDVRDTVEANLESAKLCQVHGSRCAIGMSTGHWQGLGIECHLILSSAF